MTRRLLIPAVLTLALLFGGAIAEVPVPAAGAAVVPASSSTPDGAPSFAPTFDVRLGDGILQVRVRGGDASRTEVSIRIELPRLAADLITR
jgi:hypothetical protein